MRPLAVLALAALAACAPDADPAAPDAAPPDRPAARPEAPPAGPPPTADRPATLRDTVTVEGMSQAVTLRLVSFPDAPIPFSTYVPQAWADDLVGSGEGTAVRLTAGEEPMQGVVSLFVPSGTRSEDDALELARSVAESYGSAEPLETPDDWVYGGYSFASGDVLGTVWVGSHAGTPFYIVDTFPPEIADGFVPAAGLARKHLRWSDDGTGL